jgi:tetratricopeptide (TPR) repeat protein
MGFRNWIYPPTLHRPLRAGFVISWAIAFSIIFAIAPAKADTLTLGQWLDIGWDYYNLGIIDEAFNTFLEVVDAYPESGEAHLALGEIYLEMGITNRGRIEILRSLNLDDESDLAARAHFLYARSIREEDPWNALIHLNRAHHLGGSQSLQFEIGIQHRFCRLLIRMPGRAESGPVVLHYPSFLLLQPEADDIALQAESTLYQAETFCDFDVTEPVHIFIYPSERAVRAEIMFPENDWDPVNRELHIPYTSGFDFLQPLSVQVIIDLQNHLNRHAGARWVFDALPVAITGRIEWTNAGTSDAVTGTGDRLTVNISVDDVARALYADRALVDIRYLVQDDYSPYVTGSVRLAELGSFLNWVQRTYERVKLQELITQPNIETILGDDLDILHQAWLADLNSESNLISDPALALEFVRELPLSQLAGDPELPLNMLREGLAMYLEGDKIIGTWQIRQAINLNPGLAMGYYTLGWIACAEKDSEEAEEQLGMALMLFEKPREIAWCHSLLAPIYLKQQRWEHAAASIRLISTYAASDDLLAWAQNILPRLSHIIALQAPSKLDSDSLESSLMRSLFEQVDSDLNPVENESTLSTDPIHGSITKYINNLMDETHARTLTNFYMSLIEQFPATTFRHEITAVGTVGSAIYVEVLVHANFPVSLQNLPPELQVLKYDGYPLIFQVIPTETGWQILDWEDAWFPESNISIPVPQPPD